MLQDHEITKPSTTLLKLDGPDNLARDDFTVAHQSTIFIIGPYSTKLDNLRLSNLVECEKD